jgi:hypothetical protein
MVREINESGVFSTRNKKANDSDADERGFLRCIPAKIDFRRFYARICIRLRTMDFNFFVELYHSAA